jgi:hypothetical protein
MSALRFGFALLLASVAWVSVAAPGYSFTLTDDPSVTGTNGNTIYWGADNTYPGAPYNQDVIGTSPPFGITDAVITRTTTSVLNDTLNVRIYTNYAGQSGVDGTTYGSLFLNPLTWSVTGSSADHYSADNFVNGNQNWAYAVTTPSAGTTTGLYATGLPASGTPTLTEHDYHGVPDYYTTSDGRIVMSNVSGDPITYPHANNNGWYFRQGQAVLFDPSQSALDSATFTVGSDYIEYDIVDNGLLGNTFALSWAMTCANDVIQGLVTLSSTDLTPTPLPAALPLFAGGFGILALFGRRKKRRVAVGVA